jgi:hypothetical protein
MIWLWKLQCIIVVIFIIKYLAFCSVKVSPAMHPEGLCWAEILSSSQTEIKPFFRHDIECFT